MRNRKEVHRARKSCSEWQRRAALRRRAKLALHALRLRTVHPLQHTAMSRYGLIYARNEVEPIDTSQEAQVTNNNTGLDSPHFTPWPTTGAATGSPAQHSDSEGRGAAAHARSLENLQKKLQSDIMRKRAMRKNCRRRRRRQKNINKAPKHDSEQQGNVTVSE
ncbi:hypothetical protein FHG87_012885 [Trinorchestia longiramus]|nr:hypothetical protein FHG87_012885 [Trinorchestia longiramus]